MLVVVVLPLVPVTSITLYPLETVDKIFLSNFNATLPGKVVPPFKMVLVRNNVNFVANILRIDLILIFFHHLKTIYFIISNVFITSFFVYANTLGNIFVAAKAAFYFKAVYACVNKVF